MILRFFFPRRPLVLPDFPCGQQGPDPRRHRPRHHQDAGPPHLQERGRRRRAEALRVRREQPGGEGAG